MDSLVNFEIEKLLKEKGFEQKQFNMSWYNERGQENGRSDINIDGKTFSEVYPNEPSFYGSAIKTEHKKEFTIETFAAPTIAQAVMWIYEKHNIWIEARLNLNNNKFESFVNCFKLDNAFDTPTEAYNDAILFFLK